jgi:hypothetical protein
MVEAIIVVMSLQRFRRCPYQRQENFKVEKHEGGARL